MSDEIVPRPPARGRRRLLQPGQITPGEAATIAGVYESFVQTAGDDAQDEDEAIDDCNP